VYEYEVDDLHPYTKNVNVVPSLFEDAGVDVDIEQFILHLVNQVGFHRTFLKNQQEVFTQFVEGLGVYFLCAYAQYHWFATFLIVSGNLINLIFKNDFKKVFKVHGIVNINDCFLLVLSFVFINYLSRVVLYIINRDFLILKVKFVWFFESWFFRKVSF